MRVLITGAGGFIGSHLVEDQLSRGNQVTAVDLNTSQLASLAFDNRLKIIQTDFIDPEFVNKELKGHEICYHLASAHLETGVGDEYFWKVNVGDTLKFVKFCHEAGIERFIHCSTVGVYGDIQNPPADEESECHPVVAYERSKLAGESAVREYALKENYALVVLRPAWVYGPRCSRTEKLFRMIKKGRFFFIGDGRTLRHPIYISDMVKGFELASKYSGTPGEIFIIAGAKPTTLQQLTNDIADALNVKRPKIRLPKSLVWVGATGLELFAGLTGKKVPFTRRSLKFYTGNTAFSIAKAQAVLDFQPQVGLDAGIERTLNWLIEENRI